MFRSTLSTTRRCELCSLDTTNHVLCLSCLEMIARLSGIAMRADQTEKQQASAARSVTKHTARRNDVNLGTQPADTKAEIDISRI